MATAQNLDKVLAVADYFIKKNEEDKKGLTPLKLQKLLYYAQAWNMVLNKDKLFNNDFEAWVHGPAIPDVWRKFKEFDFAASHADIANVDFTKRLSASEIELLDSVWGVYGKFDGKYLETLTHNEQPWLTARRGIDESIPSNVIISTDSMRDYYGQKLAEAGQGA